MQQKYQPTDLQRDFKVFYDENLRGKYEELEVKRQKYIKKVKKILLGFIIFVAATVILCVNGIISEEIYTSKCFLGCIMAMIFITSYVCSTLFAKYRAETKSTVMKKILSFWGKFTYSSHSTSKIRITDLRKSGLFRDFNQDTTDDSFHGVYRYTEFCVAEKKLLIRGKKSSHSVFEGIIILLGLNKEFKGQTTVEHKALFSRFHDILRHCNSFKFSTIYRSASFLSFSSSVRI